uniref:Phosphatidylinositol polyphosphate 5-phosphatase type IV n=1 Tax=Eptatretus burgeri TaxID=7764 RepID=A0A8C4NM31_EPTBU
MEPHPPDSEKSGISELVQVGCSSSEGTGRRHGSARRRRRHLLEPTIFTNSGVPNPLRQASSMDPGLDSVLEVRRCADPRDKLEPERLEQTLPQLKAVLSGSEGAISDFNPVQVESTARIIYQLSCSSSTSSEGFMNQAPKRDGDLYRGVIGSDSDGQVNLRRRTMLPPLQRPASAGTERLRDRVTICRRDLDLQPSLRSSKSDVLENGSPITSSSRLGVLPPIPAHTARNRNYLQGSLQSSGSLLGAQELEKHFPSRQLSLFISTWNMQGRSPVQGSLADLLLPQDFQYLHDLYAVGTQEATPDRHEWEVSLQETLGPSHVLLSSTSHGSLHLAVFIRRDLIWFCSEAEHASVITRVISQIKTKGAVAISFTFFGTSLLFITSHFTSGDGKVSERIQDYNKIISSLALPCSVPLSNPYQADSADITTRFDAVFWFGDFNFRLDVNRNAADGLLRQSSTSASVTSLLEHDQLAQKLRDGTAFAGFSEAGIDFLPTYKYDLDSDAFDSSAKQRVPSYTDRILYKSKKTALIEPLHYSSCIALRSSDHRPVFALFHVALRPGRDNIPLCAGLFCRDVYLEAMQRRVQRPHTKKTSSICSIS